MDLDENGNPVEEPDDKPELDADGNPIEKEEEIKEEDAELEEIFKADKTLTLGEKERFRKVYGKLKATERENVSLSAKFQENDEITNALIEENKQLKSMIKEIKNGLDESSTKSIDVEISSVKAQLREAIKAGDVELTADLNEKLIELGVKKATPKPKEKEENETDLLKKKQELLVARFNKAQEDFMGDPKNADILLDENNLLIAQAMSAKLAKDAKYKTLPPETFWNDVAEQTRKLLLAKGGKKKLNLETGEGGGKEKGETDISGLSELQKKIARKSFPAEEPEVAYKYFKEGLDMIQKQGRK